MVRTDNRVDGYQRTSSLAAAQPRRQGDIKGDIDQDCLRFSTSLLRTQASLRPA
jgi:hypothetical protein